MGQQPNIELSETDLPRSVAEPPPAKHWKPTKPGLITAPDQVPTGGRFGSAGPDAGWALRLLADAELPDSDPRLRGVLTGLVTARAAALGRAPIPEDIEVGLVLCGYWSDAPAEIIEQRVRWMAAVPHEQRPGATAAGEVDRALMVKKPEQVRFVLGRGSQERSA